MQLNTLTILLYFCRFFNHSFAAKTTASIALTAIREKFSSELFTIKILIDFP